MFDEGPDVAVIVIVLGTALLTFLMQVAAAFVGAAVALSWHERRKARQR